MNKKYKIIEQFGDYYIVEHKPKRFVVLYYDKKNDKQFNVTSKNDIIKINPYYKKNFFIVKCNDGYFYLYYQSKKKFKSYNLIPNGADKIVVERLISGDSKYFIGINKKSKGDLYSLYQFDKDNPQNSKVILKNKQYIFQGQLLNDTEIDYNKNIFSVADNYGENHLYYADDKGVKQLTKKPYQRFGNEGLLRNESPFVKAYLDDGVESAELLYYDSENQKLNKIMSDGVLISTSGLIRGVSKYLIAGKFNNEMYIYEQSEKEKKLKKQLDKSFKIIKPDGLVRGESNYYIVVKNNGLSYLLYYDENRNIKNVQVTSTGWDDILPNGLVKNQSNFYVTEKNEGNRRYYYLFDKYGKLYLKVESNNNYKLNAVYHILENKSHSNVYNIIAKISICR